MKVDRAVDAYLRHVAIERGLSENTVAAYRRDLSGYAGWLREQGIEDTAEVTSVTLASFIADRAAGRTPIAASSLARLQSSVRGLHRFLAREGIEPATNRGHGGAVRRRESKVRLHVPNPLHEEPHGGSAREVSRRHRL